MSVGVNFGIVTRPLRHVLDSGEWGSVLYDADALEIELGRQDDEIQVRESFNSERLRAMNERNLREEVRRPLSPDADSSDIHGNDVERLNEWYSRGTFDKVLRILREDAQRMARELDDHCAMGEADRAVLQREIGERAGLNPAEVSLVLGDLLFTFDPKLNGEQCLLELAPGRVTLIPLLLFERALFASEYIRISKSRYADDYASYQRKLTKPFEARVGEALRMHAPRAEIRAIKLPGLGPGGGRRD